MTSSILDAHAVELPYTLNTPSGRAKSLLPAPESSLVTWAASDIYAANVPEPTWAVPELLPAGAVSLIAGAPKAFKSMIAMQLCIAASSGGEFLGYQLDPRDVLYVSLEGNLRLLKKRLEMQAPSGVSDRMRVSFDIRRLHDGLEMQVNEYLHHRPTTGLVIIDTLVRVAPWRRKGASQYEQDAGILRQVEQMANVWPDVAFVFVHHTRECPADDPLDLLNGSRGLSGTIDTAWLMRKANSETEVVLQVRGRQIDKPQDLALRFDETTSLLGKVGPASRFIGGDTRQLLLSTLDDAEEPMNAKDLAERTGVPQATVRQVLSRMDRSGQLVKPSKGLYAALPI